MMSIYRYANHNGSTLSTVVQMRDGHFGEVRRNNITWTAAHRAANPGDTPRTWNTLQEWHATLPIVHVDVANWHRASGWKKPAALAGETEYWLGCHLSHFMRSARATESQLIAAFQSFEAKDSGSSAWHFFTGGPDRWDGRWEELLPALAGHGHILEDLAIWEDVEDWHAARGVWGPAGDMDMGFSAEMRYFLGTRCMFGGWEDIQRGFRGYWRFRNGGGDGKDQEDDGYFYVDYVQRSLFGITEVVLPQIGAPHKLTFSELRRVLLENGHIWLERPALPALEIKEEVPAEEDDDDDDDDDSEWLPEEDEDEEEDDQEGDVDSDEEDDDSEWLPEDDDDEDEEADEDEDEDEEWLPPPVEKKDPFKLVNEVLEFSKRCAEQREARAFEEIDAVFFRVETAVSDETVSATYKGILVEQFVNYCLRQEFADRWKSHVFERLQMRATLEAWREETVIGDSGRAVGAILRFLEAFPA